MITATPTSWRTSGSRRNAAPIRPTEIPSVTKTTANPVENSAAWTSTARVARDGAATATDPPPAVAAAVTGRLTAASARKARYTGTRARTQGVRNDAMPAANARARLISMDQVGSMTMGWAMIQSESTV